ncbi:MAG TPA: glycosyltransferase family 9 protein [Candidatus Binatia bacterium]|jgi:heptosyltransferase-3|nr:glycosyltransferase family 9 protein [Candidatus Binatia bacterium]
MTPFAYRLNDKIRNVVTYGMRPFMYGSKEDVRLELPKEDIDKILLVRPNFRIGDSVLATPGIFIFRKNFPRARIDFVGGPVSKVLFENLPIDHHYQITRRFPDASWAYLALLRRIRSVGYDLAVELSVSQSAMGAFIVGLSGSRFKLGRKGKRDFCFNVKIPKPEETNKYQALRIFLGSIGVKGDILPSVILSAQEKDAGWKRIAGLIVKGKGPIVGVFVGARIGRGKRWPKEYFLELIHDLNAHGLRVVVFLGPEEKNLIEFFRRCLKPDVALVYEPSLRIFAAMISRCQLFVACDSGPMHLACALGVRTVAIFQKPDSNRWGPPPNLGTIAYEPGGVSVKDVLRVCLAELSPALHSTYESLNERELHNLEQE